MLKENIPISYKSALRSMLSFVIILLMMPLGHAFVVLMEHNLQGVALFVSAFILGLLGVVIAIVGDRLPGAAMRVLSGAFGAILFWGAWVEFVYISFAHKIHVQPLMDGDIVFTKPEYLMMPSSIPFAILAFIMYLYLAPTHWGVILKIRQFLGIKDRNFSSAPGLSVMSFIDLVLLIWWSYLILLIEFDPAMFGPTHFVTLITAGICLVAGILLLIRSLKAISWASALRQAIVNVCIIWTFVEVMIKLHLFTEIWVSPEAHITEMILIVTAFVISLLILKYAGHKKHKN